MTDEPMTTGDDANVAEHAPETIAEVHPPLPRPVPTAPEKPSSEGEPAKNFVPGWPKTFYHPVHGGKEFKDPNEHAGAGGTDGDWRFETAALADIARTAPEADLVVLKNNMAHLQRHTEGGTPVIRNSATATESAKAGYPEPGLMPAENIDE